jgi:hypothetical protein
MSNGGPRLRVVFRTGGLQRTGALKSCILGVSSCSSYSKTFFSITKFAVQAWFFAFFALWREKIANLLRYVINKCYICNRF